jgi:hypothetical protein
MATSRGKTMNEEQGWMILVTDVAPMTTLTTPNPFPMRPPINIPKWSFCHRRTLLEQVLGMEAETRGVMR